jgi:hypothetical protein
MVKIKKKEEKQHVLRIPEFIRNEIIKMAEEQEYPPKWTDMARQVLLNEIQKHKEDNKKET